MEREKAGTDTFRSGLVSGRQGAARVFARV
jgi:hypothetical protein